MQQVVAAGQRQKFLSLSTVSLTLGGEVMTHPEFSDCSYGHYVYSELVQTIRCQLEIIMPLSQDIWSLFNRTPPALHNTNLDNSVAKRSMPDLL